MRLLLLLSLLVSGPVFADGPYGLDQDYKKPEKNSSSWVLLNRSHVSDVSYSRPADVNYFFEKSIDLRYLNLKLNCGNTSVRSIQAYDRRVPIDVQLAADGVYKVFGPIDRLRVSLFQNKSKDSVSCDTELYGFQDIPGVSNVFLNNDYLAVSLGTFYVGGLSDSNEKEINSDNVFLKSIYISFSNSGCADLFLAEVGTFVGHKYDLAAPTDTPNLFIVNDGEGLRASRVRLSFVGKSVNRCEVKVYGSIKNFVRVNFP
jgi:hypothetical protein